MNRFQRGSLIGMTLLLTTAMGGAAYASGTNAHPAAAKKTVKVVEISGKYAFKAQKITITAGTKVIWNNETDAAHTVTTTGHPPRAFNKHLPTNAKVSITFTKKGTYRYFCTIHPYMHGTITVK